MSLGLAFQDGRIISTVDASLPLSSWNESSSTKWMISLGETMLLDCNVLTSKTFSHNSFIFFCSPLLFFQPRYTHTFPILLPHKQTKTAQQPLPLRRNLQKLQHRPNPNLPLPTHRPIPRLLHHTQRRIHPWQLCHHLWTPRWNYGSRSAPKFGFNHLTTIYHPRGESYGRWFQVQTTRGID